MNWSPRTAAVPEWRRRGGGATALADGAAGGPTPSTSGTVALGHTECDVVRGIGAPDNVSLSNNSRGDRVAVVNYSRGQRAGIYTFTAGRLTSIERAPEAAAPARAPSRRRSRRVISRSRTDFLSVLNDNPRSGAIEWLKNCVK